MVPRTMGFVAEMASRKRPEINKKEFVRRWGNEISVAVRRVGWGLAASCSALDGSSAASVGGPGRRCCLCGL